MKKVFKLLSLFVMVASMAFVTSCTKENSIVGKWQFSNATIGLSNVAPEILEQVDLDMLNTMANSMYKDMVWEFKSDNTVSASAFFNGQHLAEDGITYEVKNNKLIFTDPTEEEGEQVFELDIVTLDAKNLVVSYSEENDETGLISTVTLAFNRI